MLTQYISEIVINNFRNYLTKKIDFIDGINIIIGNNGSGKTSILEAIYFFEELKSFRKTDIPDIINANKIVNPFLPLNILFSLYIKTHGCNFDKSSIIYEKIKDSYKRIVKVDDNTIKKISYMKQLFKITYLIPQMNQFFTEQSITRRKFLDKTANLLFINHYETVKKYEFFVKERLKILSDKNMDLSWLNIVEKKIVELGVSIASIRNETINIMNNIFNAYKLSFPVGILKIDGIIENMLYNKKSKDVEEFYADNLKNNRINDTNLKRTNFGVHKSDLVLIHREKNIKANLCSTGEQKLLLIALMIIRCIFSKNINKGMPILLLDDIINYLDQQTIHLLFLEIEKLNIQTFITGIDLNNFNKIKEKANIIKLD